MFNKSVVIVINDLHDNKIFYVYMYADDTKLYREIKITEDQRNLQKDLDTFTKLSEIWLLKFIFLNLTIGIREGEVSSYHMTIDNVKHEMTKIEETKDSCTSQSRKNCENIDFVIFIK